VAPLTSDGRGNLYGTTLYGGSSNGGTVYTVKTDGTGFQRLHSFAGGGSDGFEPMGSLVINGSGDLCGTTGAGGSSNAGTVFTIKADGGGFRLLHSFADPNKGKAPCGSLALDDIGNLYGTTCGGGPSNGGTVFKLGTDGTGFHLLHSFAGGVGDGRGPGSVLLDGSGNIYGTTGFGGQQARTTPFGTLYDGSGTIYRLKTDGTGFQLLRAFAVDQNAVIPTDPSGPSSLIGDGLGSLYGTTFIGGTSGVGTVFKVRTDGSGFEILHSFSGGASDGRNPIGSLFLDRLGTLYGMTQGERSASVQATAYKIRTDGTGYQVLRTFIDTHDGIGPQGSLILDGSGTLYGTMAYGGSWNAGTVFAVNADGSFFQVLHAFAGFSSDGGRPWASLIPDESGYLYGTTTFGGFSYEGTVFRIRSDGTGFQILHGFSGGENDGDVPQAPLILDRAGNLYGTTINGGPSNRGTVFKLRKDGTSFQLLHTFLGGVGDGSGPFSGLIVDGADNLYGTTSAGGPADLGTVFRMRTDGTGFQLLHTFTFASGSPFSSGGTPLSALLLDGLGNLYGTTIFGGEANLGTVFKVRMDGTKFELLHSFTDRADDGSGTRAALIIDGSGNLYGTTSGGGSSNAGAVFRMKTDGTGFQLLHSFVGDESDGGTPYASVILDGFGNLYGTTYYGGPSHAGAVFTMRTDGTAYLILHMFGSEAGDGRNSFASLFLDGSGSLIGTTSLGGEGDFGTVFALSIGRHHAVVTPGPLAPVRRH
jgi:uncharacterized repeat protein (TIGR03803 family)